MNLKGRNLDYDVIRIVALIMIVLVHVSAYMVIFFPDTANIEWSAGNLFNGLARAGVPMFVMLSGALLLNEDKVFDAKSFYKKNLLTMVLLTIGWMMFYGLFYAVALPLIMGNEVVVSNFFGYLLSFKGSNYPHLWYMFMVVGMYLMIPVLRLFVKRENKTYVKGIMIASVLFGFGANTANFFTSGCEVSVSDFMDKFHLEPVTGFIGLLLSGWYLSEFTLKRQTKILLYGLGVAAVLVSTLMVHSLIDSVPEIRDYVFEAQTLTSFVYAAALFTFIKSLCKDKTTNRKAVKTIADCSFGIYLIHVLVMELFVTLILPYESFGLGKPISYILISYTFTIVVSFFLVYLLGYIKGVRRIFFIR